MLGLGTQHLWQSTGPRNTASMAADWQWCQSNGVKGRFLQSDKKEPRGEAEEALRPSQAQGAILTPVTNMVGVSKSSLAQ